jgi:uncharacterized membrane protein
MSWVLFTILAVSIFAIVNVLDRIVYSKHMYKPIIPPLVSGVVGLIASIAILAVIGIPKLSVQTHLVLFASGLVLALGIMAYVRAVASEEISRAAALFNLDPLFTAVLAFLILGEQFPTTKYFGILLLVIGAIVISMKKTIIPSVDKSTVFIFCSIFLFALFSVIAKYALTYLGYWQVFAFARLWMFICLIPFYFLHYKDISKNFSRHGKKSVGLMATSSIITLLGYLLFTKALSTGYATLVSAVAAVQPLFVLVITFVLSRYYPKILTEEFGKRSILTKTSGIVLMILGAILLS